MDIAAASIAMSQGKVKADASVAIMKKAMKTAEQQPDFIDKMMDTTAIERAAQPHLGGSIDLTL